MSGNLNIDQLAAVLACEIEAGIFEKHVAPALEVARKVAQDKQQNTQQPVAYRWRFGSESIDTRWHYSDVPLVPYLDRTVECLYTAPPVPRDVLMAFGVEVADKAHAAGVIGNLFTDEDIAAIADRYASQVQPEPVNQQMLSAAKNALTDADWHYAPIAKHLLENAIAAAEKEQGHD